MQTAVQIPKWQRENADWTHKHLNAFGLSKSPNQIRSISQQDNNTSYKTECTESETEQKQTTQYNTRYECPSSNITYIPIFPLPLYIRNIF